MLADGSVWLRGQTAQALSFSHSLFAGEHARPRRIPRSAFGGHCAVVVACGKRHTLVLSADGRAWTAWCNLYAQLGYTAAGHSEHFACVAGNGLAELRLVAEPQAALAGFAEQQRLESAVPVLQRFLQDVGLWVVVD